MAAIKEIVTTLRSVVRPGMSPKELRAAVREKHPEVHKKEIVRAAFYALTEAPVTADAVLADLHNFALSERVGDDEGGAVRVSKKRKKGRSGKSEHHAEH